ncbi:MAG: DUF1566 domain-containing protein [Thermodesulfobacteriota bacterium]
MERENFFELLELSTDPPEEDPKNIEEAIKKMQAKWSRFRNHPTKSIQAKKYLGMLPEIRQVMLDPEFRKEELSRALSQKAAKSEEKMASIDRHLTLHLTKGYVTDEEVAKLSQLHDVPEADIRKRIRQKEEDKFTEIDRQVGMRMAKGFITEDEVAKLAKMHNLAEEIIRKRVAGPIVKAGETHTAVVETLDRALLKVIEDNLAIIGKQSLYEFLEVEPNSSLKLLQKKAHKKETEILKIGKKDAVVTASQILAGHCVSIFKSEESRAAYDVSRARSHLKDLDADIEVAGMDGKIRAEYFSALVTRAAQFGLDEEEAREYIRNFAKEKQWAIEGVKSAKPARKTDKRILMIAAAAALVLVLALGVGGYAYFSARAKEKAYVAVVEKASALKSLAAKQKAFEDYVAETPKNKFTEAAEKEVAFLKAQIVQEDFKALKEKAGALAKAGKLEEAAAIYEAFAKKYDKTPTAGTAKKAVEDLNAAMEERDFKALEGMLQAGVEQRMVAYVAYLTKHPKGAHAKDVKTMISDMSEEYYQALRKEMEAAAAQERYQDAIALVDRYCRIYDNARAQEMLEQKNRYTTQLKESIIYQGLVQKADALGTDHDAAMAVYNDFVAVHPGTSVQKKIDERLAELQAKKEAARLAAARDKIRSQASGTGGRFVEDREGTLKDTKTGLVWTMLDAKQETQTCADYFAARKYVGKLNTGGYKDWRLPTPQELKAVYKNSPAFPGAGNPDEWYWTSRSFRAWRDRWISVVEVVTAGAGTSAAEDSRDSYECGNVRAVRP